MNGAAELRSDIQNFITQLKELEQLSYQEDIFSKLVLLHELNELPYGSISVDHRKHLLSSIQNQLQCELPSSMCLAPDTFSTEKLYLFIENTVAAEIHINTKKIHFNTLEQSIFSCNAYIVRCVSRLRKFRPKRLEHLMKGEDIEKIQEAIDESELQITTQKNRIVKLHEYQEQVMSIIPTLEKAGFKLSDMYTQKNA